MIRGSSCSGHRAATGSCSERVGSGYASEHGDPTHSPLGRGTEDLATGRGARVPSRLQLRPPVVAGDVPRPHMVRRDLDADRSRRSDRQHPAGHAQPDLTWDVAADVAPGTATPALVVISPGRTGAPACAPRGCIAGPWRLGLEYVAGARWPFPRCDPWRQRRCDQR